MMVPNGKYPRGDRAFGFKRATHVHNGVDIFAPLGSPVYSPVNGVVRLASEVWRGGFSGYGRFVVVATSEGELLVAHLDQVDVQQGQPVEVGERIGTVGKTKFSRTRKTDDFENSAPHIHVEFLRGVYPANPAEPREDPTALAFPSAKPPKVKPPVGGDS